VIRAHALVEVDRIVEQFGLGLVDAHHSCLSDIPAVHSFKQHRKIVIWATRPPVAPVTHAQPQPRLRAGAKRL
jgi:hypothetical protein